MNNVPLKLRRKWAEEDLLGIVRVCMRTDADFHAGRITKEHALYHAGKQLQDEEAILDICAYHHGVDEFQDGPGLDKERNIWIALNRMPESRLRELSKGEDRVALRDRLNAKYGVWKPPIINWETKVEINY